MCFLLLRSLSLCPFHVSRGLRSLCACGGPGPGLQFLRRQRVEKPFGRSVLLARSVLLSLCRCMCVCVCGGALFFTRSLLLLLLQRAERGGLLYRSSTPSTHSTGSRFSWLLTWLDCLRVFFLLGSSCVPHNHTDTTAVTAVRTVPLPTPLRRFTIPLWHHHQHPQAGSSTVTTGTCGTARRLFFWRILSQKPPNSPTQLDG